MTARALRSHMLLRIVPLLWVLGAAVPAAAAETSLRLIVPANPYSGTGEVLLTPADGAFTVYYQADGSIRIEFSDPSFTNRWSLGFAAVHDQPLAAGPYYDAGPFPRQADDQNGIRVSGTGYGACGSQTGSFEVKQVSYGAGWQVAGLWILFEARCVVGPAIRGEFRWNAEVGVAVTAPLDAWVDNGHTLVFPVTATSTEPGPISLSAIGLPPGAIFADNGDGTGSFGWSNRFNSPGPYAIEFQAQDSLGHTDRTTTRVVMRGVRSLLLDRDPGYIFTDGEIAFFTSDNGDFGTEPGSTNHAFLIFYHRLATTSWLLDFAAPPGEALGVGVYEGAVTYSRQGPGQPGLFVSGIGPGCDNVTGRFEVKQIGFDPAGRLATFWATFEQHCEDAAPALRGEIRFNADVPLVVRAPTHRTVIEEETLAFDVQGFDALGGPMTLSATGVSQGAAFADHGDGTARFEWTPAVGQAGIYTVVLRGENGRGDADLLYTRIEVTLASDDFDRPIRISALPFRSTLENTRSATPAPDDPVCIGPVEGTVWYAFTPLADAPIYASTSVNYNPGAVLSVYTGTRGALTQIACGANQVRFEALAGQTYYFMAGFIPWPPFTLSVDVAPPPPPNDDRDHATVVESLPFSEALDTRSGTPAADDPAVCIGNSGPVSTVWYAYTPAADTRVTVDTTGSDYFNLVNATPSFSGPSASIGPMNCGVYGLSFNAYAGVTYYLMIGSPFGIPGGHLVLSITGRPLLAIQSSVAADGSFDPRTGAARIHGTVTCSRPAQITVYGSMEQDRAHVAGTFEASVACGGTTAWSARLIPDVTRNRHGRFTGGRAHVSFYAVGAALDDPGEFAFSTTGQATVLLKVAPPGWPGPSPGARRSQRSQRTNPPAH